MVKNDFEPVIGLEIHVQLKTLSKMFCSCANDPGAQKANVNICPICLAHPGTLPSANALAVEKTVQVGLALGCEIPLESEFARKSYFYPDLPKGYQISQADKPLCQNGFLNIGDKSARIRRIHLEEDTAKLIHVEGGEYSLVDFNRAGLPLMELVTEPDFKTGEQVELFARKLQLILRSLGASDADMEKGEMRVEANVSVQPPGAAFASGTKVELKNINSFRAVKEAIDYEISRQTNLIAQGQKVEQETRGWNGRKTIPQRKKEIAQEYRYFPEPDLKPIFWMENEIQEIRQRLPELPSAKRLRFEQEYLIDPESIQVLIREIDLANYFEKSASELLSWMKDENVAMEHKGRLMKLLSNYLISDLKGLLASDSIKDIKIAPENFAELIILVFQGKIPSRLAKDLLKDMLTTGGDPSQIMAEKNIAAIDDEKTLIPLVSRIIEENPKAKEDYRKGKTVSVQFLIGQLMRETRGSVLPKAAEKLIIDQLNKSQD